jgi:mannose-6-phosphate isomerase
MNIYSLAKPWGSEECFAVAEPSTIKIVTIHKGGRLSLQTHAKRQEYWRIITGNPMVTVGEEKIQAAPGDSFVIKIGEKHRIEASDDEVKFLEISTGTFDEEDIVRLDDVYGRI